MEDVLSMDGSEFKMARDTKVPTDRCGFWQSAPYCRTCGGIRIGGSVLGDFYS